MSLNSSHAVIVGANVDCVRILTESSEEKFKDNYFLTLVYDFRLNIWIKWAKLPLSQPELYVGDFKISFSPVVFDDKYGNR